jgi:hypothetical protein
MTNGGEKQSTPLKPLYDARIAIEHVQMQRDVQPLRLFGILFPLWDVETTATQREERPYELIERYIERGLDEGQLHTAEELSHFFGLQSETVKKILHFLTTIGHVTCTGSRWDLTPLGRESIRAGTKYVAKEKRVRFYFDGYTSYPLRKEHYNSKRVHILSPEEAMEVHYRKTWGYRFEPLYTIYAWQPSSLHELATRVDRASYNMPPEMQGIQPIHVSQVYIPMYVIESKKPSSASSVAARDSYYAVYTGIAARRDLYFEQLINRNEAVLVALRNVERRSQYDLWMDWLRKMDITDVMPLERADGSWQVTLPRSMFEGTQAKFDLSRIGDYELNYGYWIQIWCNDKSLRRKAALDHVLRIVKKQQKDVKRQYIQERLQFKAQQLQTDELELTDLQRRAQEAGMQELVKILK